MLKNVTYSLWGKAVGMVCLMLLDVCLTRFLKVDRYAEWVYFFSILTMLFYIGWFGVNVSAKVHIAKCVLPEESINCLTAALLLRFLVSVIVMLFSILIMPGMASYLGFPMKYPDLRWLLTLAGVLIFLNSFTEFYKEYFIGKDQFRKVFTVTVIEYAGYLLYSLVGLILVRDVRAVAIGYMLSGITVGMVGIRLVYRENRNYISKLNKSFKKFITPIFKYAIPIAVIGFGGLILIEMDIFMLGLLSTKENVAIYSIAKNLCSKATHINYSLTVGVMTSFAVITPENYKQRYKAYKKATRMNWVLTLVVAVGMFGFANLAIRILYGYDYAKAGFIMRMLVFYYAFYGISNYYSSFLDFRDKAGIRGIMYLSVIVINLILNYLWIPVYGAEGAAMATDFSLFPYTVMVIVLSKYEWKRLLPKML